MKYLCLAYQEQRTLDHVEELRQSGRLVLTHALQSVRSATTVRVRHGRLSTTDGPFAETKESLGGFFLVEARDLNEAIQVAAKWPSARLGSIEVRPIEEALRLEGRYGGGA